MAERSKAQTPIPSRQGTLRGAPSSLKRELRESRKSPAEVKEKNPISECADDLKSEPDEEETPEPKVDEFGEGFGV